MEHNLYSPYASVPSRPHDARLVFYSHQTEDMLFATTDGLEIRCRAGLRAVGLSWTLARNLFLEPFLSGRGLPLPSNSFVIHIPTVRLRPGFYDLRVKLDTGDAEAVEGICTFGYKIDSMPIRSTRPSDFELFWKRAKDQLAAIPLKPQAHPLSRMGRQEINAYNTAHAALPSEYDPEGSRVETIEVGKVDFAGAPGLRVHGWLAKPPGQGPFPAMLVLPGAGINARPMPLEHARHGYVAMDIQVHGCPVDLPKYEDIPGYYRDQVYEPPEQFYFYRITQNCLRAVDYLASRPDVDINRMVVVGGSQGGRMAVIVAALDSRIAAAVPAITNSGHYPYLQWAEACNAAKPRCDGMDGDMPPALSDTPVNRGLAYHDLVNFAPDVHCPVLMNVGLIDGASPPATVYAIYQSLGSAQKQMIPMEGLAHDWSAEFDRRAWRWLDRILQLPPPRAQGV